MKYIVAFILLSSAIASAQGKFELTTNLEKGKHIPKDYYGNNYGYSEKNQSPSLEWKNEPVGTKSFAITFYDKDAPTGSGFWHYALLNIPSSVHRIELGELSKGQIPQGAYEFTNDTGKPGYLGPCPPPHHEDRYTYTVYALKVDNLVLPPNSTPGFMGFNLWMNTLDKASFMVKAGSKK